MITNINIQEWILDSCSLGQKLGKAFVKTVTNFRDTYHGLEQLSTVELHLCGLIGSVILPDKQKIRIIGFFVENRLHWQFEVRLLLFTVRTRV